MQEPPKGLNSTDNPVFSGFLDITNADESYQVTYLGLAAALKDTHVVDTTDTFFGVPLPAVFDANSNVMNTMQDFTFQGTDFPTIVSRLNFGTPLLRFDLVQPRTVIGGMGLCVYLICAALTLGLLMMAGQMQFVRRLEENAA